MTKTNIKDHLAWLITCKSVRPPRSAHAPQTTGPPNLLEISLDRQPSSQRPVNTCDESAGVPAAAGDACTLHPEPEFLKPALPASASIHQAQDVMARLQSGPKSSHKPRLLSESIPLSLQTPTSSSIRIPGTSLKDRYSAQWQQRATGKKLNSDKNVAAYGL